jgi:MFS family permease
MQQRWSNPIFKLYVSNFLTGLVFWYGIEKLFMQHIGIDAIGIGICTALYVIGTVLFDIPSGMLADRWSRKGLLILSAVFLMLCSIVAATSQGLVQYAIADILYALYLVATSGTYQAIIYDVLHEQGRAQQYSRIMGTAYGLFLVGAGVANFASGFIAQSSSLATPYWLSIIPCVLNCIVLATINEPTFHKAEQKEKFIKQFGRSTRTILQIGILRSFIFIWCSLGAVEIFKQDFSQLYALQFSSSEVLIGIFWALYAFAWAAGSFVAHKLQGQLNLLLIATFVCTIAMGATTHPIGIGFFLIQAFVAAAAYNLIETRVQNAAPSAVRASILSVLSTGNRFVMIPSSLLIGWLIVQFDVFIVTKWLAILSAILLIYWLLVGRRRLRQKDYGSAKLSS